MVKVESNAGRRVETWRSPKSSGVWCSKTTVHTVYKQSSDSRAGAITGVRNLLVGIEVADVASTIRAMRKD